MTSANHTTGKAAEFSEAPNLDTRLALSVAELARALGVSARHVRERLHEIPHVYLGQRVVFPVDAVREWLGKRCEGGGRAGSQLDREVDEMLKDFEQS